MKLIDHTPVRHKARIAVTTLALVAAVPATAQSPASPQSWYGVYEYSETVPRGDITGSIDTRVTLNDSGCRIDAAGVQTEEHIRCNARMQGKSLVITFKSYADGGLKNRYGVQRYKQGQPLLTFTRTPQGLVTAWQGYTMSDARSKTGKYFMKASR